VQGNDVPSDGTRRRSCGGKLLHKMRERDGRIEDAAKVFDEMPMRAVLKNARVLLLGEASRVQDAVGCRAVCDSVQGNGVQVRCDKAGATRVQQMRRKRSSEEWTCVQQRHVQESRGAAARGSRGGNSSVDLTRSA
jgi:hypothetical protein